jgi:hypothetical protein
MNCHCSISVRSTQRAEATQVEQADYRHLGTHDFSSDCILHVTHSQLLYAHHIEASSCELTPVAANSDAVHT